MRNRHGSSDSGTARPEHPPGRGWGLSNGNRTQNSRAACNPKGIEPRTPCAIGTGAPPGRRPTARPLRGDLEPTQGGAGSEHGNRTHNSKAGIPYSMRNRHGSSDREPPARSTHQGTPSFPTPKTESARKRATERTFSSKNLGHFCLKQAHILRKKPRRTTWVPTPLGAQVALFSPIFYFFFGGREENGQGGGSGTSVARE